MNISYFVTVHNEDKTLEKLLSHLILFTCNQDEIVILDDFSDNQKTQKILDSYKKEPKFKIYQHNLDNNYGTHKNYGNTLCNGEFIFQIDADECPKPDLICNIKDIIKSNPDVELFFIPRINDFIGVTQQHAMQWGWKLTPSASTIHEKIIDTNSDEYKFLKINGYILEESKIS